MNLLFAIWASRSIFFCSQVSKLLALLRIQSLVLNSSRLYHNILFLRPLAIEAYHWHYQDFISWMVDNGTSKTPRCYCTMLLLKDSCLKIKSVCLSVFYLSSSIHSFILCIWILICMCTTCIHNSQKSQIFWNWSNGWLWTTVVVLGTEPSSSDRATDALNH